MKKLTLNATFSYLCLLLCSLALPVGACSDESNSGDDIFIVCQTTSDCVSRGGVCQQEQCRADNECSSDADCASGSCVPDADFGGLCVSFGPPNPGPAWTCTSGSDCPVGQGCGSDGLCHIDGECSSSADCSGSDICYNAGNDDPAGFCASDRPAVNPYCRADGQGACRYECYQDGSCAAGSTCVAGFCHWDDECADVNDCTPNHLCEPLFDHNVNTCTEDPDPSCVNAPDGVCRLACASTQDCLAGGTCETDNYCHADNECTTPADCTVAGETCLPREFFGGLCGVDRP